MASLDHRRRPAVALALAFAAASLAGCNGAADPPRTASTTTSPPVTTTTTTVAATSSTTAVTPTSAAGATTTVAVTPSSRAAGPGGGVALLPTGSAAGVADALAEAEPALRTRSTPPADVERLGRAQQVAYRQLVAHPEWTSDVLARLPADLRPVVRANSRAGAELRALTKPRTELPPWRIVAPAPADELLGYYKQAEAATSVPWPYLAAIHLTETRMGRIRGTSTAGAQGPMQFLPATWGQYGAGGDINSNRDAIMAAARLLSRNGAPGDMGRAVFSYNHSNHYVTAVTEYAGLMAADEGAYRGYYQWQVFFRLVDGDRLLPVGYGA